MRRRTLTELSDDPNLISGVYNYCDRWCERCPLSSRCLVYATEQEDELDSPERRDLTNEAFWQKLGDIFTEAKEMIAQWAKQSGIDLAEINDDDSVADEKRRRRRVDNHPLARAGKKYANDVTNWFREFDQLIELSDTKATESEVEAEELLQEAREVIYWYQYQIAVKTMRALSGKADENSWPDRDDNDIFLKDSDGSAKVALIGIDRSIAAWRLMQLAKADRAESIVPLILQLQKLCQRLEKAFPDARSFIRPGFDENQGHVPDML